jgi:hypothetical protein
MRLTFRCLAALSSLLLNACASTLPPEKATYAFDRRCQPVAMEMRRIPVGPLERPASLRATAERDEAIKLYSRVAVHIAEVMDLLPLLNRLAALERRQAPAADIDRARRRLTTRLQLANLEVSSAVAEIECEVQRADEVQDRLKEAQTTRTTTQTILGVIFGGLANILSGGISMATQAGDAANIASVTGGALEVLFGTSANFTKVRQEFSHPHNHLQAFRNGDGEHEKFFPRSVWRFLSEPDIRDMEGHTLREVLLQTWNVEGRLGPPGSQKEKERKTLLFSEGGLYDSDELHIREAMLQQLESSIQLMHQDLETLLREVLLRQAQEEERGDVALGFEGDAPATADTASRPTPAQASVGLPVF